MYRGNKRLPMTKLISKLLLAMPAMLVCTSMVQATTSPLILTATPASVSLTYQKPSTAGASVAVSVAAATSTGTFFTVDPATVPIWLTVSALNGTAVTAGTTISFTANAVSASLGAGVYTASVHLKVPNVTTDVLVPVTLTLKNPAASVSVSSSALTSSPATSTGAVAATWTQGSAIPSFSFNVFSSADPILFTAAVAPGSSAPSISLTGWTTLNKNFTSGLAYSSFGTPITVNYSPQVFALASVGDTIVSTLTITGSSTVTITITITVAPAAAVITSLTPAITPSSTNDLQVVLSGSGFVPLNGSNPATAVTIGGVAVDVSKVAFVNSSTLLLTIDHTVFPLTAGTLAIGASNNGGTATSKNLTVTDSPILYSVVNAASFIQSTTPSFAPYETISIFGDNFGADPTVPEIGALDSFSRYPTSLPGSSSDPLTVTFTKLDNSGNPTSTVLTAYLLFATQTQINLQVPSNATAGNYQVTVTSTPSGGALTSAPFNVAVAAADPGIYTTGSAGTGQAAILMSDYTANSSANIAHKGSSIVSIYLTGLGTPNSAATNVAVTTAPTWPASCISTANFMTTINTTTVSPAYTAPVTPWTTIDGAVLQSAKIAAGKFPPCFTNAVAPTITVTIGGVAATVSYAGFVADSWPASTRSMCWFLPPPPPATLCR